MKFDLLGVYEPSPDKRLPLPCVLKRHLESWHTGGGGEIYIYMEFFCYSVQGL